MNARRIDPYYEWLGIQPSEHPVDFYRLLGIARFETNVKVIERAADRQMGYVRQFQAKHPKDVADLLSQLALARITLANGDKKRLYDSSLQNTQVQSHPVTQQAAAESPERVWYIQAFGIPQGPFTLDEMQARIKAKEVRADTMVRKGVDGRWMLAREARTLFDLPVSPPPAPGTGAPRFTDLEPIAEKPDLLSGPLPAPEDRTPGKNVWICPACRWPVPKPKIHCPRCGFMKRVNETKATERHTLLMVFFVAIAAIATAFVWLITS